MPPTPPRWEALMAKVMEQKRKAPSAPLQEALGKVPRSLPASIRALKARAITPIIGEIKPRSPTEGVLRRVTDPCGIVGEMVAADVAGISILTEEHFFGGSRALLAKASACSRVPVLMKDFLTEEKEIEEARRLGADAVLLIVKLLGDRLRGMYEKTLEEGLTPLLEVHTRSEMEAASRLRPDLIGINNRDLSSMKVDLRTTSRLRRYAPTGCLVVSESGYRSRRDVESMAGSCDAFLIGSVLMKADIREKILELQGRLDKWSG